MSAVTQITIQLTGEDPEKVENPLIAAAAAVVHILGPICGPLTHITVTCNVRGFEADDNTYNLLLDAARTVCASTLTHLSFSLQARYPSHMLLRPGFHGDPDNILSYGCEYTLDVSACEALSSLSRLTHLKLQHATLSDAPVWAALPPSLLSLQMTEYDCDIPENVTLNLRELLLKDCGCYELLQLLDTCPQLCKLDLRELHAPSCVYEQDNFNEVLEHPGWIMNGSGGPDCTPVTALRQARMYKALEETRFAPWEVLPALPTLPSITEFRFDFMDGQAGEHLFTHPVRLLHHIPRAFPHVEVMRMDHVLRLDSDLTQLYACASLRQLYIQSSSSVTGEALLLLVAALPKLTCLEVWKCERVKPTHKAAIARYMKRRGMSPWFRHQRGS